MVLPQIILRDAEVAYMEMRQGKPVSVGWYSLEGSLNPNPDESDRYDFQLQSRGRESMGPSVDGILRTQGGISVAHMQNFSFGPDIKTMLLAEPRQWCEWHQLQGRIDVPEMAYNPNPGGGGPIFHAELVLSNVEMAIHPEEWMSRAQNQRIQLFHDVLDTAEQRKWLSPAFVSALRGLSTPQPIRFTQVSGNLLFTESGIKLKAISGKVENNWFNIDGDMSGYSPDAPANLTISSVTGHDLDIPDISPDYLGTLPKEAQDVIEHLHPHGTCVMRMDIQRREPGGKPIISGQVDIKDGQFVFADFPYPISRVQGQILIGNDPIAHMEGIRVLNVQGHGNRDGPNAEGTITINGFIGPLTGVAGVSLDVEGINVSGDPSLRNALPPDANRAMQLFDSDGHGEYPKFHGSFSCHVAREPGPHKPFINTTDITLDSAEGKLAVFPYPLKLSTGRIEIREGYLNIVNAQMHHGNGHVDVNGIVRWNTNQITWKQLLGPDLAITVRNVPIDDDFTNALPASQRALGAKRRPHRCPRHGRPRIPRPRRENISYTFDGSLHDGALQSGGGEAAMSGLNGTLHLTPTRLEIVDLKGQRGPSAVTAQVLLDWSGEQPQIMLSAAAKNLELNQSFYQMLPLPARQSWDGVKPHGDIDATLELSERVGSPRTAWNSTSFPAIFPQRRLHCRIASII